MQGGGFFQFLDPQHLGLPLGLPLAFPDAGKGNQGILSNAGGGIP